MILIPSPIKVRNGTVWRTVWLSVLYGSCAAHLHVLVVFTCATDAASRVRALHVFEYVCTAVLQDKRLVPNHLVRGQIEAWRERERQRTRQHRHKLQHKQKNEGRGHKLSFWGRSTGCGGNSGGS